MTAVARAQTVVSYSNSGINDDPITVSDTNPVILRVNGTDAATHSGAISSELGDVDYGVLTKDGTGTLTLSHANTIDSDLFVSAGTLIFTGTQTLQGINNIIASGATLQLGDGGSITGIPVNLTNDGTFVFNRSGDLDLAATLNLSGSGSLVKLGTGDLRIGAGDPVNGIDVNTCTGATIIKGGRFVLAEAPGDGPALATTWGSTVITVADGAQFYTANRELGDRTFYLNGNGDGSANDPLPRGALRMDGGTLGGSIVLQSDAAIGIGSLDTTISSVISGDHALTLNPAAISDGRYPYGLLTLSGASTHTGPTTLAHGTLSFGDTGSLTGALVIPAPATLRLDRATAQTFTAPVTSTGTIEKTGAGTTTFGGAEATTGLALDATSVNFRAGTLALANGATARIGTLNLAGASGLTLAGGGTFTLTSALTGSGALINNTSLVFDLPGTSTLSNALSGTGTTTIRQGTLLISNPADYYGGDFSTTSVASGARLGLNYSDRLRNELGLLSTATFVEPLPQLAVVLPDRLSAGLDLSNLSTTPIDLAFTGTNPLNFANKTFTLAASDGNIFRFERPIQSNGTTAAINNGGNFVFTAGEVGFAAAYSSNGTTSSGTNGGNGGNFTFTTGQASFAAAYSSTGGTGATIKGSYYNNYVGGNGGNFTFTTGQASFAAAYSSTGGTGGTGAIGHSNGAFGGVGGNGGNFTFTTGKATFAAVYSSIGGTGGYGAISSGGWGGWGGKGGNGGDGGNFAFTAGEASFAAAYSSNGGVGGNGGNASSGGTGGDGGTGGNFTFTTGQASFAAAYSSNGGNGGNGGFGSFQGIDGYSSNGGNGGNGGTGGNFSFTTGEAVFAAAYSSTGGTGGRFGDNSDNNNRGGSAGGGVGGPGGNFTISGGTARFGVASSMNLAGGAGGAGKAANEARGTDGTLSLQGGTLELPSLGWLEAPVVTDDQGTYQSGTFSGNFAFTGGTLTARDSSEELTLSSSSKLGSALNNSSDSTRTLDLAGSLALDSSIVLTGTGALTKAGAGTLTLEGAQTYTGLTTVAVGTLALSPTASLAGNLTIASGATFSASQFSVTSGQTLRNDGSLASAVTVQDGATLGGSGTFNAVVTTESGSRLAPGNSPGTMTFNNGLTLAAGTVLDFDLGDPAGTPGMDSDLIVISGGLLEGPDGTGTITLNLTNAGSGPGSGSGDFGPGDYLLFQFSPMDSIGFEPGDFTVGSAPSGFNYQFSQRDGGGYSTLVLTTTPVPEPGPGLLAAAAAVLPLLRRRGRENRQPEQG